MPSFSAPLGRSARWRISPRSRPFYAIVFLVTLLVSLALFGPKFHAYYQGEAKAAADAAANKAFLNIITARSTDSTECGWVHNVEDQCSFVLERCADDQPSLVPYLRFYYCSLGNARAVVFAAMVMWLGLLFTTIGIAASDFFSVNLSTIATILHMPESMAGVTFLAFGNGSPDLFSTFAAMGSNSASMAVGELVGAAGFITAVVAGSMALVREFKVDRKTYMRDVCFFMVAVALTCAFLIDGRLHWWECVIMIAYYLLYVVVVVGGHWLSSRRKVRRIQKAMPVPVPPITGPAAPSEEQPLFEPYRDVPEGDVSPGAQPNRVQSGFTDISFLELGPRIEVSGDADQDENLQDEVDAENSRFLAAEVASHMRVLRPRGRRRSSIAPIRPSLVGALEFRSALAHASRDHPERTNTFPISPAPAPAPVPLRSNTDDPSNGEQGAVAGLEAAPAQDRAHPTSVVHKQPPVPLDHLASNASAASPTDIQTPRRRSPSPVSSYVVGGSLAPPPVNSLGRPISGSSMPALRLNAPRIELPDDHGDADDAAGPLSPFPQYSDSPLPMSPMPEQSFSVSAPTTAQPPLESNGQQIYFPDDVTAIGSPKPTERYRFWPYHILPPPDVVLRTLFPTVQSWGGKSIWDKFVSAMSIPSVLLLVLTLPVVDAERDPEDEEDDKTIIDPPGLGTANAWAEELVGRSGPEHNEELQLYRRLTRTHTSRSSLHSPALISIRSPSHSRANSRAPSRGRSRGHSGTHSFVFPDGPDAHQPPKSVSADGEDGEGEGDINHWNRWLVALQIFTGPQFAVFIMWANMADDLPDPRQIYVWMVLSTLAISAVLCALLLRTTSESHRPKYHSMICFLGFLIAIAWISTIAGEVVGVLKAIGIIFNISEAILGLTVFAAGNSVGDLVANITVARLGYPVMALSACFGGPMLNILLGIGIGGFWMMIQDAKHNHLKHPDRPYRYKPYKISVEPTLMVSALFLLSTLAVLAIVVPMNKWMITKKLGLALIALWAVGTAANVAVEMTGSWSYLY